MVATWQITCQLAICQLAMDTFCQAANMISMLNKIKELRKAEGLTQGELAEAAGVDVSYISRLETGKRGKGRKGGGPTYSIIKAIADRLGSTPEDLIDLSEVVLEATPVQPVTLPPITEPDEILRTLRRFKGLSETEIDFLFGNIAQFLNFSAGGSKQKRARGRSAPANPHRG